MQYQIYIYAFRRYGCTRNGSHRSSNGFKYSYTTFEHTYIFSSVPLSILSNDIIEPIRKFFSKFHDSEIKYRDWEPEEYGVSESEIVLESLLHTLNQCLNTEYSNKIFLKGSKDLCPYPSDIGLVGTTYDEIDYTN